jgi:hypothetical protein
MAKLVLAMRPDQFRLTVPGKLGIQRIRTIAEVPE